MLGPPPRWEEPDATLGKSLSKTTRGPKKRQGNPGASWSPNSAECGIAVNPAKELHHIGLAKYETAIEQDGLVGGLERNRRGQAV